jgi:hypothetical protein
MHTQIARGVADDGINEIVETGCDDRPIWPGVFTGFPLSSSKFGISIKGIEENIRLHANCFPPLLHIRCDRTMLPLWS